MILLICSTAVLVGILLSTLAFGTPVRPRRRRVLDHGCEWVRARLHRRHKRVGPSNALGLGLARGCAIQSWQGAVNGRPIPAVPLRIPRFVALRAQA